MREVSKEMIRYNVGILAVQETRWKGSGIFDTKTHTVLHSGIDSNKAELGVAFVVEKGMKGNILDFKPINERICVLRYKTKFFNLSIINTHAETEEKDELIKEKLYQTLGQVYDSLPSNDIKLVIGDLNAKIGREPAYREIIGNHSLHAESNDNGTRVIDFAASRDMVVMSTQFPRKNIHKWTWTAPGDRAHNQIDYVLVEKRGASSIKNVRTYRGADCNSDHYLVNVHFRCRISRAANRTSRSQRPTKLHVEKLQKPEIAMAYQRRLNENLSEPLNIIRAGTTIDDDWEFLKRLLLQSAESVLGHKQNKARSEWFDQDCIQAISRRNMARRNYLERSTRSKRIAYEDAKREAKEIIKKKKRAYMNLIMTKAEENFRDRNPREAYRSINFFKRGYQPKTTLCRAQDGELLAEKGKVMDRWRQYFQKLLNLNAQLTHPDARLETSRNEHNIDLPTMEDTRKAIIKLKNNKAPGLDNIPGELLKHGGSQLVAKLHELILKVWKEERMPEEWRTSVICPIYKKGDKLVCENYRGISLISTAYKVFTNILRDKLEENAENIIGEYQAGFRPGRSTMDHLFTVRQTYEKFWEFNIDVYQLFIDFKQAYDSIDRGKLLAAMLDFEIHPKLVRLVGCTMQGTRCQVKVDRELTSGIEVSQGLKQGDGLAPMLFNLALEYAMRRARADTRATFMEKSVQITGYADDLNILGRSIITIKEAFNNLEEAAKEVGLTVNEHKTKLVVQCKKRKSRIGQNITIGNYNFEVVNNFTYLGSNITANNDEGQEVQKRVAAGNRAYYSMLPIIKSRSIHRNVKLRLYKTLIRTVVCYGSEAWTITGGTSETVDRFERKILKRIYGPVSDGES